MGLLELKSAMSGAVHSKLFIEIWVPLHQQSILLTDILIVRVTMSQIIADGQMLFSKLTIEEIAYFLNVMD